ncbi:LysR substrate-binding domain-containing protein [Sphingomonas sp.]|uniref:LysR substrate-binding domain-containing protein n=1 Tax=Sphingomonas sp. TaxID=28214 RepID=UPI000DB721C6|nr:LysR substrate-binding domain-containing protein [Sphingomonas sp.]PZU07260.1 MAG: LysR family transcriptional regulator [Sphingomonas sp.]
MLSVFGLNLRHLSVALAVRECGSISAASQSVNLSQPAITQALAKLEQESGHVLFVRHARGVVPTEEGDLFLTRAEAAIGLIREAVSHIRRAARLPPILRVERIVTMTQLRALAEVERAGSYSLAGRRLGLSQPSLHRAASESELVLGMPLLALQGRTVHATTAGERLVRAIRLAAAELQAGIDDLQALTRAGAGLIRIGTLSLPAASLLPTALARFGRSHPEASVTIMQGNYEELLAALRDGDIDLLLGALRDPVPVNDVKQQPLFVDDLSIACAASHPLAGSIMPDRRELARYPWVISERGAPMRASFEALFQGAPDRPTTCVEAASILMARALLLEDNWLSLMSHDHFRIEQQAGLLATVGPPLPASHLNMGVTTRTDWRPTTTQAAMLAALRDVAAERGGRIRPG